MDNREELEKLDINQLYEWVNQQYDNFAEGKISETVYQSDLDYYKSKLATSNNDPKPVTKLTEEVTKTEDKKTPTSKVRSTSIAGLRKKLLDELNS
ncbi:MAG: hypothetical protein HeimC2_35850 [Candidatus Heimdallarchaeota archaeon LC_2]|nr:MAG: hypothetical protein HeimC2_35850 [Candidatus Heimdallarchaeota archaeon LC_2]